MSDHTCLNCGSSNITQLKDRSFITSQNLVQELIILKKQKEKQIRINIRSDKELKRREKAGGKLVLMFLISSAFPPLLLFVFVPILLLSIIKYLVDRGKENMESSKYKNDLYNINKKIDKCFSLYYCFNCNYVMDLEKRKYEQVENTNELIKQIIHTKYFFRSNCYHFSNNNQSL